MFNNALMGSLMRKVVEPEPTYALLLNHEENYNHGDNVPIWSDKSGNDAHAVQDTASRQPTWDTTQFSAGSVQAGVADKWLEADVHDIFEGGGGLALVFKRDSNGVNTNFGQFISNCSDAEGVVGDRGYFLACHWRSGHRIRFSHYFSDGSTKTISIPDNSTGTLGARVLMVINYNAAPGESPAVHTWGSGAANGLVSINTENNPNAEANYQSDANLPLILMSRLTSPHLTFDGAMSYTRFKKGGFFTEAEIEDLKILAKNTYQVNIPD